MIQTVAEVGESQGVKFEEERSSTMKKLIGIGTIKDHEEARDIVAVTHGEIFFMDGDSIELFRESDSLYMRKGSLYYFQRYGNKDAAEAALGKILDERSNES